MEIRRVVILFLVLSIIVFVWYKIRSKDYDKVDHLLTNHMRFSGTIISYHKSSNHAYGIIRVKIIETNTKEFADSSNSGIFPYKVKGEHAEFYGYIPVSVKVGYTVLLDSDKRTMTIYDDNNFVAVSDVRISSDSDNVAFVRQYTMFK